MDDGSDLVANANTGSGRPRSDGNYRGNDNRGNNNGNNYNGGNRGPSRPTGHFDPMKMPCPRHSRDGKPANHSLENCTDGNIMRYRRHYVLRLVVQGRVVEETHPMEVTRQTETRGLVTRATVKMRKIKGDTMKTPSA